MSGRCRFLQVPFMVDEEFALACKEFGFPDELSAVAFGAVEKYHDSVMDMWTTLKESKRRKS